MALAHRIIPVLLHRDGALVKGKQFDAWRSVGHPLQAARIHASRGVDELIVLDIGATPAGRGPDFKMVEKLCHDSFTPITVGGGVRSVDDVRDLLNAGADKVAIGSGIYLKDGLVESAVSKFGSQAIVASVDYRYNNVKGSTYVDGTPVTDYLPFVVANCGINEIVFQEAPEIPVKYVPNPPWIAQNVTRYGGAGEVLLQAIDLDGTMQGYDLDMIASVADATHVPVIASCGAGSYEHMHQAIDAGADAVAASSLFLFTDCTPKGAAQYLDDVGVEVRV